MCMHCNKITCTRGFRLAEISYRYLGYPTHRYENEDFLRFTKTWSFRELIVCKGKQREHSPRMQDSKRAEIKMDPRLRSGNRSANENYE
jgi:hypothetical protein